MIDSWNKLTVGKYLEIKEIIEDDNSDIDKSVGLLCVLGDYDEETVLDLPVVTFNRLIQSTGFLYEEPKPRPIATKYKLNNMVLEVSVDINKLTTSQFIDYQTFVKNEKYIIDLLSVFLIPQGSTYNNGYDIDDVKKVIRDNLCILDALGISAFFLLEYQALLKSTVTYSMKQLKKMLKKEKNETRRKMLMEALKNLEESGVL